MRQHTHYAKLLELSIIWLIEIYQVLKELDHTTVKVTEKYTKFRLSELEQDFPNLTKGYVDKNIVEKDIRDTNRFPTKLMFKRVTFFNEFTNLNLL